INQLIQWIYEINYGANAEVPNFELYAPEDVDLTLAQRDKILSETGVKFTKEYFIKTYGLDEDDFDIREDFYPIQPNFNEVKQFKEETPAEDEKIGQEQIEELFKFISEERLNEQGQAILGHFFSLLESCESYEDLEEILTEENLRSKSFEKDLQKALFLCELQGRTDGLIVE
ncbi:DUF935 family protein, partial [bacterium]|nr:DUF935 family protein [bacterium]